MTNWPSTKASRVLAALLRIGWQVKRQSTKIGLAIGGAGILAVATLWSIAIYKTGFWRGPDAQFGDQHLKTTVALVELHKTRYGQYPETLDDLEFTGAWDGIALQSVSYKSNDQHSRYCVEVERGWVAKPDISLPAEFWQGTGFDSGLCGR